MKRSENPTQRSPRLRPPTPAKAALWAALLATLAGCTGGAPKPVGVQTDDPRRIGQAHEMIMSAQAYERAGDSDAAIATYRSALDVYREFPAAWNNLGTLLLERQRYLEAAECFGVAADLAPQDPRPVYNLGLCWDRAGYLTEAVDHYQRSVERDRRYLPALRGSIRAESLLSRTGPGTLDRIRTALQLEQDPQWRSWLELQKLRIESAGATTSPARLTPVGDAPISITPATSPMGGTTDPATGMPR